MCYYNTASKKDVFPRKAYSGKQMPDCKPHTSALCECRYSIFVAVSERKQFLNFPNPAEHRVDPKRKNTASREHNSKIIIITVVISCQKKKRHEIDMYAKRERKKLYPQK